MLVRMLVDERRGDGRHLNGQRQRHGSQSTHSVFIVCLQVTGVKRLVGLVTIKRK